VGSLFYCYYPGGSDLMAGTELDHQHARCEMERLHLIVRLVGASEEWQG
jgi:hypothetical protein